MKVRIRDGYTAIMTARYAVLFKENALGGLVVSVLATGPTRHSVAGSNTTEDGGFLWVISSMS
jgi:hypothetical protein